MTRPASGGIPAVPAGAGEFHPPGSDAYLGALDRVPAVLGAAPDYVGLVRPSSAEELANAVKFARSARLGLLRLYNRSNVGARLQGDGKVLIVDLGRMDRILEVNPDYAYARVEPGVSFAQLAAHIESHHLPLRVDSGRDPDASVAGSIFSKGFGYTPYGDHTLVHCGGEYVLPDGDRLRTGMGAMPENRAWQLYKYALGPYSDGLAVQSDLMIPTQAGIWLMGQVPAYRDFAIELPDDNSLAAALETLRPLRLNGTLAGTLALTHREFDARRSGQSLREAHWRLHGALYGLPKVVEIAVAAVQAAFAGGAARWVRSDALSADPLWQEQSALMAGRPGIAAPDFAKSGHPSSATLNFAAPIEGSAALEMLGIARRVVGQDVLTELSVLGRSLLQTIYLTYDRRDGASLRAMEALARRMIPAMGGAGYGLVSESVELSRVAESLQPGTGLKEVQKRIAAGFS